MHVSLDAFPRKSQDADAAAKVQRVLNHGPLSLRIDEHQASVAGNVVPLTGSEFAVLHLLVSRRNVAMTKDTILDGLLGAVRLDPRMVDVFVSRTRKKLMQAGLDDVIRTVGGRGYMVSDAGEDGADPGPRAEVGSRPFLLNA